MPTNFINKSDKNEAFRFGELFLLSLTGVAIGTGVGATYGIELGVIGTIVLNSGVGDICAGWGELLNQALENAFTGHRGYNIDAIALAGVGGAASGGVGGFAIKRLAAR